MTCHFLKTKPKKLNTIHIVLKAPKNANKVLEQRLLPVRKSKRRNVMITNEQLNTALYEKMYEEQKRFIEELKNSTPEIVIENAYELVIREDILLHLEENDLEPHQCRALLKEKEPLSKLFLAWEKHEGDHMNEIRDCIESKANELHKLIKLRSDRDNR